ncbi:hypothetical protein [Nocardia terpenica]|uniref:Uncharacterized protein n=1 Tax=Nocardia terpenica TaxID=455432 RepID=A0A164HVK6_9NOCA|nr:hypothetical protein [Nocardia terpenica]KZM68857.1 hypothetical protein AWN90_13795 [Nocardia terpenica]NQE88099.1 hypothetical protein [Nocardia terpenica]
MKTKTIRVSWSTVEYYHDVIEVPADLDLTDESAVLEQIACKASYCSDYSDSSDLIDAELVSDEEDEL